MTVRKMRLVLATLMLVAFVLGANTQAQAAGVSATSVRFLVLMYHYISTPPAGSDIYRIGLSVTPEHFQQQMQWLKDNSYTVLTGEQAADALATHSPVPAHSVLLTFDDGYEDAYTTAFPILKQFGFSGTFFVITNFVDQNQPGYLTWGQAVEMAHAGMSIEDHTRTHDYMLLADHTQDWLNDQIAGAAADIQSHTNVRVRLFAYPSGRYDRYALMALKTAKIDGAFTTAGGVAGIWRNPLTQPRLRIRYTTTLLEFSDELSLYD
jgi:peptidoglycan/xylan/chitin deacetylase (PgdA/CDA1 family)